MYLFYELKRHVSLNFKLKSRRMDFFKVRVDCRDFSSSFILDMPDSCTRICNVKLKFILSILTGETSRETDPFTIAIGDVQ